MQASWGFPAWVLTLAFSAYAFAMLVALLTVGSLSDHLGRRPVLIGALGLQATAMVILACAPDMTWVVTGRTLQGIATGAATSTLSALVTELTPAHRPTTGPVIVSFATQGGMAAGALVAGAVSQWVSSPVPTVFSALAVIFMAGIVLTLLTTETVHRRSGAWRSLLPRASVPKQFHREFIALIPVVSAVWMTGGYFMSLLPGVVLERCGASSSLTGGILIGLLAGVGSVSGVLSERISARATALSGCLLLVGGTAMLLASLTTGSLEWCFVAAIVTGLGFGTANSGAFRLAKHMAPPGEAARIFAAVYAMCYFSCGAPIIAAGFLADSIGQSTTTHIYGTAVILVAFAGALAHRKRQKAATAPSRARPGTRQQARRLTRPRWPARSRPDASVTFQDAHPPRPYTFFTPHNRATIRLESQEHENP